MSNKTVTTKDVDLRLLIDPKLLFEQKCDLLDVIGFFESYYEDYPDYDWCKKKIASLDGVVNMLDTIAKANLLNQ